MSYLTISVNDHKKSPTSFFLHEVLIFLLMEYVKSMSTPLKPPLGKHKIEYAQNFRVHYSDMSTNYKDEVSNKKACFHIGN